MDTITATLTAVDPRARFASAVSTAGTVIRGVRPDQLGNRTPCSEFDVRTLLGHLVGVLHNVTAIGRQENPFASEPDLSGVADDGWAQAWTSAVDAAKVAWADDATLTRRVVLPWFDGPGGGVLLGWAAEVTIHTWDVATATGQAVAWDEDLMPVLLEISKAALPAEGREALFEAVRKDLPAEWRDAPPPYGEAVPVADDRPLIDHLVAWHGRRP
jgi:uncharacterized protein (TIGR03086 family)